MNIKEYLGFENDKELEEYFISAIVMALAILCLSYISRNYYMTTIEYVVFLMEILMTCIIGYKMMINEKQSILVKMALICFLLTLHIEWVLMYDYIYFGVFILILLLISILYNILKYKKHLSIIKITIIATIVLSLAFPLEIVYQLFIDYSMFTSDTITIDDELETVMLLQNDVWQDLILKEKMNVLETIAHIELNELGVYDIPTLRYDYLDDPVLGEYIDANNTIILNKEYINEGYPIDIIETIIHECRHKYQYMTLSSYDSNEEDTAYYNYVALVKESIDNYIEYSEDEEGYYNNYVEIDATNYADMRIEAYKQILNSY